MAAPRWKTVISNALKQHKDANVIQVATVDVNGKPHARSHIFRSFLETSSPAFPLLLTTSDIRTPKVSQIVNEPQVEVVWWIKPTNEQLRITGTSTLVPDRGYQFYVNFKPALETLEKRFDEIDWEAKRRETFDELSGHMRASWCRPTPGSPMESYDKAKEWPETVKKLSELDGATEEERKQTETAFGNFALLLVDPTAVDYVELGVVPNQRTFFKKEGEKWAEQIVVP